MNKDFVLAKYWRFEADSVLPFGKHEGKKILDVFTIDPVYIEFCIRRMQKFYLSAKCVELVVKISHALSKENWALFDIIVNKSLDANRILEENTRCSNRNKLYNTKSKIIHCKSGRDYSIIELYKNVSGESVDRERRYVYNTMLDKNKIWFKISIIDFKDRFLYRKYDLSYATEHTQSFEIVRTTACGLILLVMNVNSYSWTQQDPLDYNSSFNSVLPDNFDCVQYIANKICVHPVKIGVRLRTQEEIEQVLTREKDNESIYDWVSFESELRARPIDVFADANMLEIIIEKYISYRKSHEHANLFTDTDLSEYLPFLNFSIDVKDVDKLVRDWYLEKEDLKTYEYRMDRLKSVVDRALDDKYDGSSEGNGDRDVWDALTDGQYGDWEDKFS